MDNDRSKKGGMDIDRGEYEWIDSLDEIEEWISIEVNRNGLIEARKEEWIMIEVNMNG